MIYPYEMTFVDRVKGKGKVYSTSQKAHQGRSLSRFQWHEVTRTTSTPPWMGCQSIAGLPLALDSPVPIIHLGGERHRESNVSCPRTQHNVPGQDQKPGPLDPESSTLTMKATPPPFVDRTHWKLGKIRAKMGFELTTLHDLVGSSNHWATGDSIVSKGEMWVFDSSCITQLQSQITLTA